VDWNRTRAYHEQFAQHRLHGEWFRGDIFPSVQKILAEEATRPAPLTTNVIVAGDSENHFAWSSNPQQMAEQANLQTLVEQSLEEIHAKTPIACVLLGGVRQIERFAHQWVMQHKVPVIFYEQNWRRYGRGAAAQAGKQMLRAMFDQKVLLVFPGVKVSSMVQGLIRRAEKAGIEVLIKRRAPEVNAVETTPFPG
jgi:hypothetical protein